MGKIKKILACILIIFVLADPTNNFSANSLESALLISGICFHMENNEYVIDFIYSKQDEKGENSYEAISAKDTSIGGCIAKAENNAESTLYFGQTDAVFISENVYKDKEYCKSVMDFIQRNPSIDYSVYIYAVKDMPSFKEKIKDKDEIITGLLDNLIIKKPALAGVEVTLSDVVSSFSSYVLPVINTDTSALSDGIIYMNSAEYVHSFDYEIIRPYCLINALEGKYYYKTAFGEFYTDKIKAEYEYISETDFNINVYVKFSSLYLDKYNSVQGDVINRIENAMALEIKKDVDTLIYEMKLHSSDLIGINLYMHRFYNKQKAYFDENDVNIITEGKFNVTVNAEFVRNGIMY